MSASFLADKVENHILLKDSTECTKLIMEALKYHALPDRRRSFQVIT